MVDVAVLVGGGVGAVAALRVSVELAVLAVVAVVHFFLFCNVFRVSRPPELLWAAIFVTCVGVHRMAEVSWYALGVVVALATVFVIAREARKPSYHGILWRRLNPNLPEWWAARQQGTTDSSRS